MKVYDLIKQLTRFPADAEVRFDARIETDAMVKEIVETEEVSITDIDWLNKDVLIKLEK